MSMGAASGLSLAATGLQSGGSFLNGATQASNIRQQGQQTAQLDEFKANQLQDSAAYGMAKASETDTFLRQKTQSMLGNIMAVSAAANVDASSPTGNAILARTQGQSDQQRSIQVGNLQAHSAEDQQESGMYTQTAQQTLNNAYAQAGNAELGGVLGGLAGIAKDLSGISYIKNLPGITLG